MVADIQVHHIEPRLSMHHIRKYQSDLLRETQKKAQYPKASLSEVVFFYLVRLPSRQNSKFFSPADPEYLEFLEASSKPIKLLPSAEVQLERKEAEKRSRSGSTTSSLLCFFLSFTVRVCFCETVYGFYFIDVAKIRHYQPCHYSRIRRKRDNRSYSTHGLRTSQEGSQHSGRFCLKSYFIHTFYLPLVCFGLKVILFMYA